MLWPSEGLAVTVDDPGLGEVERWFLQQGDLAHRFGCAVRTALDEVIDTTRTSRWSLDQCNDQEKAYVGVKVEHVVRGEFELKAGRRGMDYCIEGVDVDCKWSKNFGGWQIPVEAEGHVCLLIWADDDASDVAVGLTRISSRLLVGGNRDQKRTLKRPEGLSSVRWLVDRGGHALPVNFLLHLPPADRDAILSKRGGDERAAELFRRCQRTLIDRHVVESIGQQKDPTRRVRGETRRRLLDEGLVLLTGTFLPARRLAAELGGPVPARGQWVCLPLEGRDPTSLLPRRWWVEAR